MTQGIPEEFNPPFITVTGGMDRYLVVVMVCDLRDDEYKIDQILERHSDHEKAKSAAIRCGGTRKMEVR